MEQHHTLQVHLGLESDSEGMLMKGKTTLVPGFYRAAPAQGQCAGLCQLEPWATHASAELRDWAFLSFSVFWEGDSFPFP